MPEIMQFSKIKLKLKKIKNLKYSIILKIKKIKKNYKIMNHIQRWKRNLKIKIDWKWKIVQYVMIKNSKKGKILEK